MILNNYDPNTNLGSIIEIDYKKTVDEISPEFHRLQILVYKETHIYFVFGVYGIDTHSEISKKVCNILIKYA